MAIKAYLNIILDICIKQRLFHHQLCIKLPQLIGHSKHFNDNKIYIHFLINDKEL